MFAHPAEENVLQRHPSIGFVNHRNASRRSSSAVRHYLEMVAIRDEVSHIPAFEDLLNRARVGAVSISNL